MKGKHLITTDQWFFAPDGQSYKAAWGEVKIVEDDVLGIKTNRISTNWFAVVGSNDKEIIIAGCQIHYAIKCNNKPDNKPYMQEETHEGKLIETSGRGRIYIAE